MLLPDIFLQMLKRRCISADGKKKIDVVPLHVCMREDTGCGQVSIYLLAALEPVNHRQVAGMQEAIQALVHRQSEP